MSTGSKCGCFTSPEKFCFHSRALSFRFQGGSPLIFVRGCAAQMILSTVCFRDFGSNRGVPAAHPCNLCILECPPSRDFRKLFVYKTKRLLYMALYGFLGREGPLHGVLVWHLVHACCPDPGGPAHITLIACMLFSLIQDQVNDIMPNSTPSDN